jgi:hypothetical protein
MVMVSFLTLHRGPSLATAELIAVSTDPELVGHVAAALLRKPTPPSDDPAVAALTRGRRRALRLVRTKASSESTSRQGGNP